MPHFKDVPEDHTHANDIEWIAEKGITKGANPPDNDLYKPDEPVTRGQMASFLRRTYNEVLAEVVPDEPEPEPDPVVDEPFPSNAVLAQPGDNIREMALQGQPVELADGHYGDQRLGSVGGAYIFSKTGNAVFDGGQQVGPFMQPSDGVTLRNFQVRRFLPDGGGTRYDGIKAGAGIINAEGTTDARFLDMVVGLSLMNGYKLSGSNVRLEGGLIHDCHRYAFNGSGTGHVSGTHFERIGFETNEVGDPQHPNHELHSAPEWGNRGICKIAVADFWIVEDITFDTIWQGPWWDIRNEPGIVRNVSGRRCQMNVVFLEVSYGSEATGRRWLVENIHGEELHEVIKPTNPDNFPTPAIVASGMTPDIDIINVTGDGSQAVTVGLFAWGHSQLSQSNASRMGIDGIHIKDTHMEGHKWAFGWHGNTQKWESNARHGRPTFENVTLDPNGRYRWQGDEFHQYNAQVLTADEMEALL